ncbi:MAG: acetoin:2,6-dichlorophenolindophenol oxidoreductase subunit alpha [Deltaproteobacteria bacterium]|nr:acetoin:2,6-dichlorophenolindophenol oxidoreductase subunit alpha [Deltaproteobacteria bacterium]
MGLNNEELLQQYRKMLVTRFLENTHGKLLAEGKIQLMSHFGTGQEAVAIGIGGPLKKEDILFGTHRGVGEYVGKGMSPQDIWCEYLGKTTGLSKGKGTLHLTDKNLNIPFVVSSLGSDWSIAVGAALATKMKGSDAVTMYFVGEGTCNQADAHPAMNMAAVWKLPIVFAVCTNQFCEMSYYTEYYPSKDVAPRAAAYGIPYEIVDGNDIELTTEAAKRGIDHARSGKGPYLIEFKTFRMALHFSGDPGGYVKQEDLDEWAKKDPIDLCQKKLLDRGVLSQEEDAKLRNEVQAEIDSAVTKAMSDPDPTPEDFISDIYEQKGVL